MLFSCWRQLLNSGLARRTARAARVWPNSALASLRSCPAFCRESITHHTTRGRERTDARRCARGREQGRWTTIPHLMSGPQPWAHNPTCMAWRSVCAPMVLRCMGPTMYLRRTAVCAARCAPFGAAMAQHPRRDVMASCLPCVLALLLWRVEVQWDGGARSRSTAACQRTADADTAMEVESCSWRAASDPRQGGDEASTLAALRQCVHQGGSHPPPVPPLLVLVQPDHSPAPPLELVLDVASAQQGQQQEVCLCSSARVAEVHAHEANGWSYVGTFRGAPAAATQQQQLQSAGSSAGPGPPPALHALRVPVPATAAASSRHHAGAAAAGAQPHRTRIKLRLMSLPAADKRRCHVQRISCGAPPDSQHLPSPAEATMSQQQQQQQQELSGSGRLSSHPGQGAALGTVADPPQPQQAAPAMTQAAALRLMAIQAGAHAAGPPNAPLHSAPAWPRCAALPAGRSGE